MDRSAFPRVAEYLSALPAGWLSYPECECKASVYREALSTLGKPLDTTGLDSLLVDYIENPVPTSMWIPEVINAGIYLAICDRAFGDEERFLDWVYRVAVGTFEKPMYRALFYIASPERLARSGATRWAAFHRGTEYEVEVLAAGAKSQWRYPPNLMPRLVVLGSSRAVQAAYRAAGAPKAVVKLIEFSATRARTETNWYPDRA